MGAVRVVLQFDAQMPDFRGRFDKRSADVVVPNNAHFVRHAGFMGIADGGRHAGVRHWDNEIHVDGCLTCKFGSDLFAGLIDG